MDNTDPLGRALDKMIVETIHSDAMEAMAAKAEAVCDITPDELNELFKNIAFNVKKKVAPHFKGLDLDRLKGCFEVIDDSINDAKKALRPNWT